MSRQLITVVAEGQLGPAMRVLTEKQRAFVIALLELGSNNHTRAAAMAGYSAVSDNSLRVTAHRLAHDDKIQAAIVEEAQRRLKASSIMCTSTLIEIAEGNLVGFTGKDRLKAIEMIMNRTGLHALTEHRMEVTHNVATDAEALSRLNRLAEVLKLDPKQLLGSVGMNVIDGEFEEIDTKPRTEPEVIQENVSEAPDDPSEVIEEDW